VAIGTANFIDPMICPTIIDGLEKRLDELNIESIELLIKHTKEKRYE